MILNAFCSLFLICAVFEQLQWFYDASKQPISRPCHLVDRKTLASESRLGYDPNIAYPFAAEVPAYVFSIESIYPFRSC